VTVAKLSPIQTLKSVFEVAAARVGLPPWWLAGHAEKESALQPRVISKPGATGQRAYGLLQLNASTFRAMMPGGDPLNPLHNLLAGGTLYRQLLAKYRGVQELALAAYNWGPANVDRLMRRLGPTWEAIKARVPASVRYYVGKVPELAAKYAPLWSRL
jgi:soluble lytic murein transglycosylase-like protein